MAARSEGPFLPYHGGWLMFTPVVEIALRSPPPIPKGTQLHDSLLFSASPE